jgi:hypothetical protein
MATFQDRIRVVVDFVTTGADRGLGNLRRQLKETDGAMGKMRVTWGAAMTSLKANAGLAAAAAGIAIGKFAQTSIDAAADLQESVNAVNVTFGEAADGILKFGESADMTMGLSERAFNEAAVSFSGFVDLIAKDSDEVETVMATLMQRAADFGSVFNLETSEALRIFRSALAGEIEPIRKFGIDVSAAAVKQKALADGIAETGEKMDEQQKVIARYRLLMERTAKTEGDFERTSDNLVNARKSLSEAFENLQAQLGEALLPAIEAVTVAARDMVGVLNSLKAPEIFGFLDDLGLFTTWGDIMRETGRQWDNLVEGFTAGPEDIEGRIAPIINTLREMREETETLQQFRDEWRRTTRAMEGFNRYGDTNEVIQETIRSFEDLIDVQKREMDVARARAGIALDAEEAMFRFTDAIEDHIETLGDEDATLKDVRRSQISVIEAVDEAATAQVAAQGATMDTIRGQQVWNAEALTLARTLDGPLQGAVLTYIAQVNNIPEQKITEIQALIDQGELQAAQDLIEAELSKATARPGVEPTGLEEARARLERILGRPVAVGVTTYVPRGPVPGAPPNVRHTGGRTAPNNIYRTRQEETFVPDATTGPGRMRTVEQMNGAGAGRGVTVVVDMTNAQIYGGIPEDMARELALEVERRINNQR